MTMQRAGGGRGKAMTGRHEVGDFPIWTAALWSGFLPFSTFQQWVDAQVLRRDPPPTWLLDLALAATAGAASDVLWQTWSELATADEQGDVPNPWDLRLGFLYLRHEREELSPEELRAKLDRVPIRELDCMGLARLPAGKEAAELARYAATARTVVGRLPTLESKSEGA